MIKTKIRERRTKKDLTQEELTQKVRMCKETIVFLEQGKYNPSLKLVLNIAHKLGSTVDELFFLQ